MLLVDTRRKLHIASGTPSAVLEPRWFRISHRAGKTVANVAPFHVPAYSEVIHAARCAGEDLIVVGDPTDATAFAAVALSSAVQQDGADPVRVRWVPAVEVATPTSSMDLDQARADAHMIGKAVDGIVGRGVRRLLDGAFGLPISLSIAAPYLLFHLASVRRQRGPRYYTNAVLRNGVELVGREYKTKAAATLSADAAVEVVVDRHTHAAEPPLTGYELICNVCRRSNVSVATALSWVMWLYDFGHISYPFGDAGLPEQVAQRLHTEAMLLLPEATMPTPQHVGAVGAVYPTTSFPSRLPSHLASVYDLVYGYALGSQGTDAELTAVRYTIFGDDVDGVRVPSCVGAANIDTGNSGHCRLSMHQCRSFLAFDPHLTDIESTSIVECLGCREVELLRLGDGQLPVRWIVTALDQLIQAGLVVRTSHEVRATVQGMVAARAIRMTAPELCTIEFLQQLLRRLEWTRTLHRPDHRPDAVVANYKRWADTRLRGAEMRSKVPCVCGAQLKLAADAHGVIRFSCECGQVFNIGLNTKQELVRA